LQFFSESGYGSVDRSGLKHVLSAAFQGVDDKFVDEIYVAADSDNRGMISYGLMHLRRTSVCIT
jgi:Ca2+-binding EF-hand superfamily protein